MDVLIVVFLFVILGALTAVLVLLLRHRPSAAVDIAGALGPGLKWVGEGVERVERNLRGDLGTTARSLREEVSVQLQAMQQLVRTGHGELLHVQQDASVKTTTAVLGQLARFGADLQGGTTQTREQLLRMLEQLGQLGADLTATQREQVAMLQAELLAALHRLGAEQRKDAVDATTRMTTTLQEMTKKLEDATAAQRDQGVLLQQRLVQALSQLQESNEKKLDQMRLVVDEKLQGTLETRITESFKLVGDRLEQVHRGLGEMQALAHGVGDLKKVLANVKNRGTWGEMQLGLLLRNMLAPTQYAENVRVRPDREAHVEFAIRMPTHVDEVVWLAIDSKFPLAAWQRLIEASEAGDAVGVATAERQLEQEVLRCAKDIAEKYIAPPHTADYGILFAPTESLYAEIARRPALLETLANDYRVVVAGPVTLSAILSSLQMAFRTLAIRHRTEDIFKLLSVVKGEMVSFETLFKKLRKKLGEVAKQLDELDRRRNTVGEALKGVETLDHTLPGLEPLEADGDDEVGQAT